MADNRPELSDHEITKHVEALVKRSGTSFFWAMRRLPKEKRAAMYSVYAFCREVDDIVDDPGEESDKVFRLGMWRGEIERLYGDRPRFPVAMALVEPVHRFGLRKVDFRSVVDGMEMDAKDTVRIADMDELGHYCDRVAGAVGRLSFRIFGVDEERGNWIAFALGQALQLTNILRDLVEDANRNRIYLPTDLLAAHGIRGTDAHAVLSHPDLPEVCEVLHSIAKRRFEEAVAVLDTCERAQRRPAVMMMAVYKSLLHKMAFRGWRHVSMPVRLTTLEKLWLLCRHGFF